MATISEDDLILGATLFGHNLLLRATFYGHDLLLRRSRRGLSWLLLLPRKEDLMSTLFLARKEDRIATVLLGMTYLKSSSCPEKDTALRLRTLTWEGKRTSWRRFLDMTSVKVLKTRLFPGMTFFEVL